MTVTETVIYNFILGSLWETEGASQNDQLSCFSLSIKETGIEMFSAGDKMFVDCSSFSGNLHYSMLAEWRQT